MMGALAKSVKRLRRLSSTMPVATPLPMGFRVMAGLEPIGRQLPYPAHGIDSDNGSVFINETLTEYCGYRSIEFTW